MAINKKRLQGAAESSAIIPGENFNTVIYTGTGVARSIIGVGFKPDFVWVKKRSESSAADHQLHDTVRGFNSSGGAAILYANLTLAQSTGADTTHFRSFDDDGFSIGSDQHYNDNGETFVAWCWKAGGAASNNTNGTITSSVSANQAAGFSIVKYTGNGTNNATVGHGISTPELLIGKRYDASGGSSPWQILFSGLGANEFLEFDSGQKASSVNVTFAPTATTFKLQGSQNINNNGGSNIAYCFHSVPEYSKIGSYTGNNSTSNIVDCGFEPAWLLVKRTDVAADWKIVDNKRNTTNSRNTSLSPNTVAEELTNVSENVNFTTTGFEIATTNFKWNASGGNYLFYAIAADPDTTTPTLAKSFNIDTYTGNGATQQIGSVNTLFTKFAIFNGTSSKIDIPSPIGNALSNANNDFSVSLWVNWNSITGTAGGFNGAIIGNSNANNYGSFAIYAYGNAAGISISFERYFNNIGYYSSGYLTAAPFAGVVGTWYNLVLTYVGSSKTVTTYVDGTALPTYTLNVATGSRATNSSNSFGSYNGSSSGLDGKLDQVRIYNTVLNQAAVTQLYNETQASASTLDFPTGLGGLALYEFNDDGDDTGGNYDATSVVNVTFDSFLFKPDLVIIKARNSDFNWSFTDTVRGVGNFLMANFADANIVNENSITAFNNAGFTLGTGVKSGTANSNGFNKVGDNYVAYSMKMLDNNNNVPIENEVGTIKSLTSVNAEAGMSIAKYTGNKTQNATIGHGLSSSPDMVIIKNLSQGDAWFVSHSALSSNQFLELNETAVAGTNPDLNHERLSTTFKTTSASPHDMINGSGENYIMYSFISISGFSKYGSYTWTAASNTAGAMVTNLGFSPDFVMIRGVDEDSNWSIYDSTRGVTSGTNQRYRLAYNTDAAEVTSGFQGIGFDSNGFSAIVGADGNTTASGGLNKQGRTYIFWAMKIN